MKNASRRFLVLVFAGTFAAAGVHGGTSDQKTVATATEEQSAVAEEINRNIATIASLADQTSDEARRSAVLSGELTDTANSQYSLVERFNR